MRKKRILRRKTIRPPQLHLRKYREKLKLINMAAPLRLLEAVFRE